MDTEEWVVYSLIHQITKKRIVNTVSRHRWDRWHNLPEFKDTRKAYKIALLAEGLTEKQARQMMALANG